MRPVSMPSEIPPGVARADIAQRLADAGCVRGGRFVQGRCRRGRHVLPEAVDVDLVARLLPRREARRRVLEHRCHAVRPRRSAVGRAHVHRAGCVDQHGHPVRQARDLAELDRRLQRGHQTGEDAEDAQPEEQDAATAPLLGEREHRQRDRERRAHEQQRDAEAADVRRGAQAEAPLVVPGRQLEERAHRGSRRVRRM
jgi:hypothetical protein